MPKLSPKQLKFCLEYLLDLNRTQAAIRAGYSRKTAKSQGNRLLTNVDIQNRIIELQKTVQEKTNVKIEDVVRELANIGFANISDVLDVFVEKTPKDPENEEKGYYHTDIVRLKNGIELSDLPRSITSLICEAKTVKGALQIKLHSKMDALEKLMRHLGGYEKDNLQKEAVQQVQIFKLPDNGRD